MSKNEQMKCTTRLTKLTTEQVKQLPHQTKRDAIKIKIHMGM
jgi:hypothetical protein